MTPAKPLDDIFIGLSSEVATEPPAPIVIELDTCMEPAMEDELIKRAQSEFGMGVHREGEEDDSSSSSDYADSGSSGTPRNRSPNMDSGEVGNTPVKPVS